MAEKTSNQKVSQHTSENTKQAPASGPGGLAIEPPEYGIPSLDRGLTIQAKLMVTSAGDASETEADRVAGNVVRQIHHPENGPTPQVISSRPAPPHLAPKLQGPFGLDGGEISGKTATSIQQAKGGGKALDKSTRSKMDRAFRADFSRVRVHTDQKADTLNRDIQSQAFTTGQDIFFRQGEYHPQDDAGQHLIAHELTHVVQQGGGSSETVNRTISADTIQRKITYHNQYNQKKSFTAEEVKTQLSQASISEANFPGLEDKLNVLSELNREFENIDDVIKYLRSQLWIEPKPSGAVASLDQEDQQEQLLEGMLDLQGAGLKYDKPWAAKARQADFWKSPKVAPYILNCWETVLLAAYRQGLINHQTFVLADKSIKTDSGASNVMSEAIYQSCGSNKIEWKRLSLKEVETVVTSMKDVEIPAGWVIVVGREGQHVGVSTGNTRAAEDKDTIKTMKDLAASGHEWIENNTRTDASTLVSDLRVSTLEDTIMQFQGAGGIYWAPLPTRYAEYMKAKTFLEALKPKTE